MPVRLLILSTIAIPIAALFASGVAARDIYVNNIGGDDTFDGGAPSTRIQGSGPCRTIRRALELARKSDSVHLVNTGQPYRESITLQGGRHSGTENFPFEFVGNGAIIDGSVPVPEDAWEQVKGDLFCFQPRLKSFQQLFIDDRPVQRKRVTEDGRLPNLQPMEWCLYERKIFFHNEKGNLPQDHNITYAGHPVGITLYEVRNVVIRDVTVQGFQLDGINAHDSVFDASVVNAVCRGNGRSGISVGGASRLRIVKSLVGNNGDAQIRTEGFSKTWVVGCDLLDNTAPKIVREGGRVYVEEPVGEVPAAGE